MLLNEFSWVYYHFIAHDCRLATVGHLARNLPFRFSVRPINLKEVFITPDSESPSDDAVLYTHRVHDILLHYRLLCWKMHNQFPSAVLLSFMILSGFYQMSRKTSRIFFQDIVLYACPLLSCRIKKNLVPHVWLNHEPSHSSDLIQSAAFELLQRNALADLSTPPIRARHLLFSFEDLFFAWGLPRNAGVTK